MSNLVANSDFSDNAWGWEGSPGLDTITVDCSHYGSEEVPVLVGRASWREHFRSVGIGAREVAYVPVTAGTWYEVSAGTRAQYGPSSVSLVWCDGERQPFAEVSVPILSHAILPPRSGLGPSFDLAQGRFEAPPNAAFAKLGVSGRTSLLGEFLLLLRAPHIVEAN